MIDPSAKIVFVHKSEPIGKQAATQNTNPQQKRSISPRLNAIVKPCRKLCRGISMLVKLTTTNQLTLPKAVTDTVEPAGYFDVSTEDGRIVLTPVHVHPGDSVRLKSPNLELPKMTFLMRSSGRGRENNAPQDCARYECPDFDIGVSVRCTVMVTQGMDI